MNCQKTLDKRIDPELLALVQEATLEIPAMFAAVKYSIPQENGFPKDFSSLWAAYLSTAMFANSQGVVALAVHDYGIQAEAFERQGYEAFKRLEYYLNHKDEARLEWMATPWRQKKLFDMMQVPAPNQKYQENLAVIDIIATKFPEVAEYAVKNGGKELPFADMVGISNNPAAAKEYAFRYRKPSQLAHLTVTGSEHFLRHDGTPAIVMNFSGGTVADPNMVLETLTMTLIAFLDLLDQFMNAGFNAKIKALDGRLNAIMARLHPEQAHHFTEPA